MFICTSVMIHFHNDLHVSVSDGEIKVMFHALESGIHNLAKNIKELSALGQLGCQKLLFGGATRSFGNLWDIVYIENWTENHPILLIAAMLLCNKSI